MMVKRVLSMLVALGLAAAACTSGERSSGDGEKRSTYAGPAVRGGTLRVGLVRDRVRSLDPAQAQAGSPEEVMLAEQLFDGLTSYDPSTAEPRPALAASWQASPDQQRWDFALRPDAKFSNGRTVTSGDVKYSLERIARKGSTSTVAAQLQRIVGYKAFHDDGTAPGLAGITTPTPEQVHFDLDQPLADLPAVLANPAFGIVPKEAGDAPNFGEQPSAGSGPFVVQSRQPEQINLVRAPQSNSYLDGVTFRLERDEAASYAAFVRGRLDWTLVPPDRVEEMGQRRGQGTARPYLAELFYGFNLKSPKLADVRYREAIVRAIDRDAIAKVIYGSTVRPTTGLVAEGVPGHQADPCGERCRHDPARSRALLGEAFPGRPPPSVTIDIDDDPTQDAVARAMEANLRAAGIPASVRSRPFVDYVGFAQGPEKEIFRLGWVGPYPTPDAFLTPLFLSGLPDNVTSFSSPEVDRLLKAGRAEPDPAKRLAHYQQAERLVMEQLPVVPIAQFVTHSLSGPRVRDLAVSGLGTFDASRVWLTPGGKRAKG